MATAGLASLILVAVTAHRLGEVSWLVAGLIVFMAAIALTTAALTRWLEERRLCLLAEAQASAVSDLVRHGAAVDLGTARERLGKDIGALLTLRLSTIPAAIVGMLLGVVSLAILWRVQPLLLVWAAAGLVCCALPYFILRSGTQGVYEQTTDIEAEIDETYFDARRALELLRMERLRDWHLARLRQLNRQYLRVGTRSEALSAMSMALNNAVSAVTTFGSLIVVLLLMSQHRLSHESALPAVIVLQGFFGSAGVAMSALEPAFVAQRRRRRLDVFMQRPQDDVLQPGADALSIRDFVVTAGGAARSRVPSLVLRPGEHVRLVGANGAGKTLLLRGLVGLESGTGEARSLGTIEELRLGSLLQHDPLIGLTPAELFAQSAAKESGAEKRATSILRQLLAEHDVSQIL